MRAPLVAFVVLLIFAACKRSSSARESSAQTRPAVAAERPCSAHGLPMPERQELPAPVASLRQEIAAAAIACDFRRLEQLAAASDAGFLQSFGDDQGAPPRFAETPAQARDPRGPLAVLVRTLSLPHCKWGAPEQPLYVWPSAFCDGATEGDWAALRELYPEEQLREARELEMFPFHRAGITAGGAWTFFIAGD